jgi:hypothetical protein
VTHDDAINALLGAGPGAPPLPRSAASDLSAAREHVARCSDCWEALRLSYELTAGSPPPGADRMAQLFGCEEVREDLWQLVGLDVGGIRSGYPTLATHLGWCFACRGRFAELMVVEAIAARGELGEAIAAATPARWRQVAGLAGETVREVVGRIVVGVKQAAAAFTEVPDGFAVLAPAGAGAMRGDVATLPHAALGQQMQFALAESGLWAEMALEPSGRERVGLALSVSGPTPHRLSVHLRELLGDRTELVARYTVHDVAPVMVKGLRPGRYVLEIHEKDQALRFKLRFDVELGA